MDNVLTSLELCIASRDPPSIFGAPPELKHTRDVLDIGQVRFHAHSGTRVKHVQAVETI